MGIKRYVSRPRVNLKRYAEIQKMLSVPQISTKGLEFLNLKVLNFLFLKIYEKK